MIRARWVLFKSELKPAPWATADSIAPRQSNDGPPPDDNELDDEGGSELELELEDFLA